MTTIVLKQYQTTVLCVGLFYLFSNYILPRGTQSTYVVYYHSYSQSNTRQVSLSSCSISSYDATTQTDPLQITY